MDTINNIITFGTLCFSLYMGIRLLKSFRFIRRRDFVLIEGEAALFGATAKPSLSPEELTQMVGVMSGIKNQVGLESTLVYFFVCIKNRDELSQFKELLSAWNPTYHAMLDEMQFPNCVTVKDNWNGCIIVSPLSLHKCKPKRGIGKLLWNKSFYRDRMNKLEHATEWMIFQAGVEESIFTMKELDSKIDRKIATSAKLGII